MQCAVMHDKVHSLNIVQVHSVLSLFQFPHMYSKSFLCSAKYHQSWCGVLSSLSQRLNIKMPEIYILSNVSVRCTLLHM